jgi:hypothetical protein
MTGWIPGVTSKSPNGLDALCQGAHHLLGDELGQPIEPDNTTLMAGMGQSIDSTGEANNAINQLDALFGPRDDWNWQAL